MPLIKSNNVPPGLSNFSLRDVENHARSILMRAREQAEGLIAEAQKEAEALKAQAYAEGLDEGRRDGQAQGQLEGAQAGAQQALAEHQQQLATLVASLSTAAAELDQARRGLEADGLREVINLAIAIAKRVTKRQGMLEPQVLAENLRDAMQLVAHAADIRIALHPSQKPVLEATLPSLRMAWPQLKHVELTDDPSIAPGGCRIFTVRGMVDADLDNQLDRVIADLLPSAPPAEGEHA